MLQYMLLTIVGACVLGLPTSLVTAPSQSAMMLASISYLLLLISSLLALFILRRGHLAFAAYAICISLIVVLGISLVAVGLRGAASVLLPFGVPLILGGLVIGRRGVIAMLTLSVLAIGSLSLIERIVPAFTGFIDTSGNTSVGLLIASAMTLVVIAFMLDRFGSSLRDALISAQTRERELEALRASLERTVSERTALLQAAVAQSEERERALGRALAEVQTGQELMREMSAPVLPVLPGVLVAPLVGAIDSQRAASFAQNILGQVERERTRYVIMDLTGVPVVDTQVAQALLTTASAVRLLGAETLLVGIRPEVAQTLVSLGAQLDGIPTYSDLQQAVAALVPMAGA